MGEFIDVLADDYDPKKHEETDVLSEDYIHPNQSNKEPSLVEKLQKIGNPLEQFKFLAQATASKPKENIQAGLRGLQNIYQGPKQLGLEMFGGPGEAEKYTQEVEKGRKEYAETPAGKSPYGQFVTKATEATPLAFIPGGMTGNLLKRMLTGGAGFGAYEGTSFVPEGESRLGKTAKGIATGAAIPAGISAAGIAIPKVMDIVGGIAKPIMRGKPQEIINKVDPLVAKRKEVIKNEISRIEEEAPVASEKLHELEPKLEEATKLAEQQKQIEEETKSAARTNINVKTKDIDTLKLHLNENTANLENLSKQKQEIENQLGEIKPVQSYEQTEEINKLEQVSKEKQEAFEAHQSEVGKINEELKKLEEEAKENPLVKAPTKSGIQQKLNVRELEKKAIEEKQELAREQLIEDKEADKKLLEVTNQKLSAESGVAKAKENHAKALNENETANAHISTFLQKGIEHDVEAADKIFNTAEKDRKSIGAEFEAIKEDIANITIPLPNENLIREKLEQIRNFVGENRFDSKELKDLLSEVEELRKLPTQIPASVYLRIYNTARHNSSKAREKAFQTGVSDEERHQSQQLYNELDEKIEEMADVLEKNIGTENTDRLAKARSDWRNKVAVLYKNPTWQTIKWKGRIEGDIMHKLRGRDMGDVRMRNIILSDPNISKNVLGHKFADNPNKLSDIGVQEQQYINSVPGFQQMVDYRNKAEEAIDISKKHIESSKDIHDQAIKREQDVSNEINATKQINNKLQKELKKYQDTLDQYEKEEPELIKYRDKLIEKKKQKKIGLEEKIKSENEVKRVNDYLKQLKAERNERESQIKEQQDNIENLNKSRSNIEDEISSIKEKHTHQQDALNNIQEESRKTEISLKEKSKLENEKKKLELLIKKSDSDLKRLNKELKSNNGKLENSRTGLYKYIKKIPKVFRFIKRIFKGY